MPRVSSELINYDNDFAYSLLVELAIHGIRTEGAITTWLNREDRSSLDAESLQAYRDFARIGERAVPILKKVLSRGDFPSDLNAAMALGSIGTGAAFETIRFYLKNKPSTDLAPVLETSEMCRGLSIASNSLTNKELDELQHFYEAGVCESELRDLLHERRRIP